MKRLPITKKLSSCAIRAMCTSTLEADKTGILDPKQDSASRADSESAAAHTNASPSIVLSVPLGHPGRPLYTAIRGNMFSTSPAHSAAHPRFPPVRAVRVSEGRSADFGYPARTSGDWVSIPSFYPCTDGYGFSLSGETELRMALSRHPYSGGLEGIEEFKFTETKRITSLGKVKKIGKGLKDFFTLRRS